MPYAVKEIFYSLQGEGARSGRPAVFCRFAGCNLWTGRNRDRASAICKFCDTDFVGTDGIGGGAFRDAASLAQRIASFWPTCRTLEACPYVIFTGGEPCLQLDGELVDALHGFSFEVAIETNGTLKPPADIDWVCVSPKAGSDLVVVAGDELKLVHPQEGIDPADLDQLKFPNRYLQPMDGPEVERNRRLALEYCLAHPSWSLSLQMHKVLGIR